MAGVLAFCGALAGMPAQAFEPPPGSKNFTPPSFVPNYFSNEAAPFGRGSQMAQPGADRFNTAPAAASQVESAIEPPSRKIAASAGRATYRGKVARGRTGRVYSASSRTGRAHAGRASARAAYAHSSAKPAPRRSAATTGHAAADRSRHAGRGTGQVRQASR